MLKLYINDDRESRREHLLGAVEDRYLLIGSGPDCDIRIDRERVSDHHALIAWDLNGYYLVDQKGGEGTLLNGRLIDSEWLEDGDSIELGPGGPRLKITIEDHAISQRDAVSEDLSVPEETRQIIHEAADHMGLYDPAHDSGRPVRSIWTGMLLGFYAFIGMLLLGLTGLNLGFRVALICTLIAFIPAVFYLAIFLWLDRFDPEPPMTLAFAFGWGATISVLFSAWFNDLATGAIGDLLTGIVFAPFIEELLKGTGVFLVALMFRKDFDSVVDGIVYAGVAALGFAMMENVDYYGRSLARGGYPALMGTFMLRGLMAPFSHVLFTSMTGIGVGVARESHLQRLKLIAPAVGLIVAMLLHGIWNALASFDRSYFIFGYFLFEMPLFIGFLWIIARSVRREGRILRRTLAPEVARGLISPRQLELTVSVFARSKWVLSSLWNPEQRRVRRQFLRSVAKLGLCLWHCDRAQVARKDTGSLRMIDRLRGEIFLLREKVDG